MLQHILIVEDDAIIGMLLEEYVMMMGREPIAVVDGVTPALARIAQGGIDAAIVDVHLGNRIRVSIIFNTRYDDRWSGMG